VEQSRTPHKPYGKTWDTPATRRPSFAQIRWLLDDRFLSSSAMFVIHVNAGRVIIITNDPSIQVKIHQQHLQPSHPKISGFLSHVKVDLCCDLAPHMTHRMSCWNEQLE
jgi:hypothetical protein